MWIALALWLWRGGDTVATPTDLPNVTPVRTIADVERDMTGIARDLIAHRDRQGDTVNRIETNARRPALLVHQLEALQDEWAWHNAGAPQLDFPVDDRADEQPQLTVTGGPLDAPHD